MSVYIKCNDDVRTLVLEQDRWNLFIDRIVLLKFPIFLSNLLEFWNYQTVRNKKLMKT